MLYFASIGRSSFFDKFCIDSSNNKIHIYYDLNRSIERLACVCMCVCVFFPLWLKIELQRSLFRQIPNWLFVTLNVFVVHIIPSLNEESTPIANKYTEFLSIIHPMRMRIDDTVSIASNTFNKNNYNAARDRQTLIRNIEKQWNHLFITFTLYFTWMD